MESPVSAQEPDFDHQPPSPRRLSALYQYHNAPEVAPAHGLEYDDTIYTSSDKMTVIREFPFRHNNRHNNNFDRACYDHDNRPPRIVFGMKIGTFLVVSLIVMMVVIGAAVGGAVGGKNMHQAFAVPTSSSPNAVSSVPPTSTSTYTPTTPTPYTAPTPTYNPLNACPTANNTLYTSAFSLSAANPALLQRFQMYCNMVPTSSLALFTSTSFSSGSGSSSSSSSSSSSVNSHPLAGAYVYSLSDCADVCASLNAASADNTCAAAFYQPDAPRPVNCWLAAGSGAGIILSTAWTPREGTEVGVLVPLPP